MGGVGEMSSAWSNIPHKIHRYYRQSFFLSKVHPLHIHRKYASITPSFFINCSSDNCPRTHGLPINNNSKIIFSWIWAKCTHIYRKSTVLNCKNVTCQNRVLGNPGKASSVDWTYDVWVYTSSQTSYQLGCTLTGNTRQLILRKEKPQNETMALRGAVATACKVWGRHRNPSLQSIPRFLKLKFHHPPSHPLHRFTSFPIYQPSGESLYLSLFSYFIFQTFLGCFGLYNYNKVILIGNQVLGFIFFSWYFIKW